MAFYGIFPGGSCDARDCRKRQLSRMMYTGSWKHELRFLQTIHTYNIQQLYTKYHNPGIYQDILHPKGRQC